MGFKFHYNQVLCLLFLFLYARFEVNSTVICNPKESLALLQFKNTNAFNVTVSSSAEDVCTPQTLSWVERTDCCFWKGVTCDNATGPIPASFGNLTQLTALWLDENALTGQVPSSISKLEQLTYLELSINSLAGQIPNFGNLSKLTFLSLSWNNFSGPLPYHVSRLPYLTDIDLSHNFLSGKMPSELFSLPSLQSLQLNDNTFSAPIDQFEPSNSLSDVDLSNNKISGSIPSSMFKLEKLLFIFPQITSVALSNWTYYCNYIPSGDYSFI
ncbi:receptor-like protein 53 [Pistacia vera]|uniref:receptor-like protein 53 n=1 Tax=Pistacia vera TaxID=55513 RepID=UPI0012630F49|nr:receptor-like protein 53 [Pistacia vera]